jgi:hypothetical protein
LLRSLVLPSQVIDIRAFAFGHADSSRHFRPLKIFGIVHVWGLWGSALWSISFRRFVNSSISSGTFESPSTLARINSEPVSMTIGFVMPQILISVRMAVALRRFGFAGSIFGEMRNL